jgi:prophage tail gpP-like protein
MSSTYTTRGGETWNEVARNTTGNDLDAAKIQRANPGALAPLLPGVILQIPLEAPEIVVASSVDLEVSVWGQPIGTFHAFALVSSIDAVAKCGFNVPNEQETRALFQPLSSPDITVNIGGSREFTGRADSPIPLNKPDSRLLDISCYSTPGILERVSPPMAAFPLEFTQANLPAIVGDLCSYHSIAIDFQAPPGPLFKEVDITPNQKIFAFLSGLSAQRGPVLTSGPFGELVVWTGVDPGNPVSRLEKGLAPASSVSVEIAEDRYYSSVTGIIPAKTKKRRPGVSFTVDNPHANDLVRPYSFEAKNLDPGELETAVLVAAGRMFAGVFSVNLELSTWFDDSGELYRPNTTIELKSPDDFIPDFYEFLIASVVLSASAGVKTASLSLVLPGVFSGQIPEVLPWQG